MTEKTFHIIQGPQSQTETRMITPEAFLKFQIKSALHLDGQYVEGRHLDNVVNAIYDAVFSWDTAASIRDVLFEIRELEKSIESGGKK